MAVADTPTTPARTGWASLKDLNRYQWFVFAVAAVAWMADCMDQQLFNLARRSSITDLVGGDPAAQATKDAVETWSTVSTAVFLVGWATGGLTFGVFGDRLGRVRTLTYTILLYSIFTGLSALSQTPWDYCLYRFLTGLGVGGVFAAAVALLAETMPANARPFTLGLMQAFSAVGNCTAALLFILLGLLELYGHLDGLKSVGLNAWRTLFLIGIVPALLVIFIQRRLEEPASWKVAKAAADAGVGKKLGSYADLFGGGWVTRHAVLGMILSFVGVVGLWGIGFFSIDLQQKIFPPVYAKEAADMGLTGPDAAKYVRGQGIIWAGVTSLAINVGAFFGISAFSWLAERAGRRPAFAVTFVAAGGSVALLFTGLSDRVNLVWMSMLMGFCLLALFGGYAIYLPELFPTRLRATGTSFCYNVGRFIAASGPVALGVLTNQVFADAKTADAPEMPSRYAGLAMCSIFLLGLAVLPFLPETKDKPLPE
ncbi:MAG: MFS transporter [Gemmataceae bacterium]|nr:MFS transporter [Gemmataceae bacterium]